MKTTELYLEQVLIGFLIIFIAALPWIPELWLHSKDIKTGLSIIGGSAALGFAFFIGIPFDRLADTLSERLDTHNRLKFALKRRIEPAIDRNGNAIDDPYPEDMLMIVCRRDQSAARTQDYHRSRVRLTRALAAYAPAMTFIATLSVYGWATGPKRVDPTTGETWFGQVDASLAAIWFGIVAAVYLVWALLVASKKALPRTDGKNLKDYENLPEVKGKREFAVWRAEPGTWTMPLLLLVASLVVGYLNLCDHPLVLAAALAGAVLTVLSAWSWWRILTTYRQFLSDCWKFSDRTAAPKASGNPASVPPPAAGPAN